MRHIITCLILSLILSQKISFVKWQGNRIWNIRPVLGRREPYSDLMDTGSVKPGFGNPCRANGLNAIALADEILSRLAEATLLCSLTIPMTYDTIDIVTGYRSVGKQCNWEGSIAVHKDSACGFNTNRIATRNLRAIGGSGPE